MKPILLSVLLSVIATTASATINCQKISCKKDSIPNAQYDYCGQFKSFSFELRKKSGFLIIVENKFNGIGHYFGEYKSSGPQQVSGKSEDLFSEFYVDAKVEKGQMTMYRRGTGLILADFELKCVGTL